MSKESDQLVKSALAAIRKETGAEVLEKINSYLKTIEHEFLDVLGDAQEFLKESISRKEKLREKDSEIERLTEVAAKAKDTTAFDALKKQHEDLIRETAEYKKVQSETARQKREAFMTVAEKYQKHVDFVKVKPFLKIPDAEDGAIDWTKLTAEEIDKNLAEIEKARTFGAFADVMIPKPGDPKVLPKPAPANNPLSDPFKNLPGPK